MVESQSFFSDPENTAAALAEFAGLEKHSFVRAAISGRPSCDPRRRSAPVASAYAKRKEAEPQIRKWFANHNDMLAEVVGRDMGWNDRIRTMNFDGRGRV